MNIDRKAIIKRIIEIRNQSGLSQEAFYRCVNADKDITGSYSQSRQSRIENGGFPTIEELSSFASFAKITLDSLIYGTPRDEDTSISYRDFCRAIYLIDKEYDITFDSIEKKIPHTTYNSENASYQNYDKTHSYPSIVFSHIPSSLDDDTTPITTHLDDIDIFIKKYIEIKGISKSLPPEFFSDLVKLHLNNVSDAPIQSANPFGDVAR